MPPKCGRPKDPCWAYANPTATNSIVCAFCGRSFSSISNFKYHIACINHERVLPCNAVPRSISESVRTSLQPKNTTAPPAAATVPPHSGPSVSVPATSITTENQAVRPRNHCTTFVIHVPRSSPMPQIQGGALSNQPTPSPDDRRCAIALGKRPMQSPPDGYVARRHRENPAGSIAEPSGPR